MGIPTSQHEKRTLERERHRLLMRDRALATPMMMLSFLWVVLLVVELTADLSSFFVNLGYVIWAPQPLILTS